MSSLPRLAGSRCMGRTLWLQACSRASRIRECWVPGGLSGDTGQVGTHRGRRGWRHPKARWRPVRGPGLVQWLHFSPHTRLRKLLSPGPGTGTGDVVMTPDVPRAEAPPLAVAHGWLPPVSPEASSQPLSLMAPCTPSPALERLGSGDVWHERSLCPCDVVASAVPPAGSGLRQGERSPAADKRRVCSAAAPRCPQPTWHPAHPGCPTAWGRGTASDCLCVHTCVCACEHEVDTCVCALVNTGGYVSTCVCVHL